MKLNKVYPEHVERLNSDQLVYLLNLLLQLEAKTCEIPLSSSYCPLKITIYDDGEDARIEWKEDNGNKWYTKSNYIRRDTTIFQCKTSTLSEEDCKKEVSKESKKTKRRNKSYNLTKKLKPIIYELLEKRGAYILFINKSYSEKLIKKRITKIYEAIKDTKINFNEIHVDIYDSHKISNWINQYPQVILYIQECNVGLPYFPNLVMQSISKLINLKNFNLPYVNSEILSGYKSLLLSTARGTQNVTRLLGLSGLGKTRLIYETFKLKNDDSLDDSILKNSCVYYDASQDSTTLIGFFIALVNGGFSGTLIIDNCDEILHNNLSSHVRRADSKLNLVSIDFNVEETNSLIDTNYIKFDPEDQTVIISHIIKSILPNLYQTDLDKITDFVQGFPTLAITICEQLRLEKINRGQIEDKFLINKIIFGRGNPVQEELEVLKSISIFEYLGFEGDLSSQRNFVSTNKNICHLETDDETSKNKFFEICNKFLIRGLLEKRGRYIFLKPKPIAVSLASMWWKNIRPEVVIGLLKEITDQGLGKNLCDQLRYLKFLKEAQDFVKDICKENAPFGSAEVLNTELGSRFFRSLVEVNPNATSKTLYRLFANDTIDNLLKIVKGRRNIIWAIEKIIWRKDLFEEGMKTLLAFVAAENETWANNATGVFLQRFHISLPGTEATLDERFDIINFTLSLKSNIYIEIGLKAIKSALKTDFFTRDVGPEYQGFSKPLIDYKPIRAQVDKYWENCLEILMKFSITDSSNSIFAQQIFAESLRGLIHHGKLDMIKERLQKICDHKNYNWNDARMNLQMTLNYEKEFLHPFDKEYIENILEKLTPKDLKGRYKLYVQNPSFTDEKNNEGKYVNRSIIETKKLAEDFSHNFETLNNFLQTIYSGKQVNGYDFGLNLGKFLNETQRDNFVLSSIEYFRKNQNGLSMIVFAGFLNGVNDSKYVSNTIKKLSSEDDLVRFSYYLSGIVNIDSMLFNYILSISRKRNEIYEFLKHFTFSENFKNFDNKTISNTLKELSVTNKGAWLAISIFFLIYNRNETFFVDFKDDIRKILMKDKLLITEDTFDMQQYYWEELTTKLLSESNDINLAKKIMSQIVEYCEYSDPHFKFDLYIQKVFHILYEKYFKQIWPELAKGLLGNSLTYLNLMFMFGNRNEFNDNFEDRIKTRFEEMNGMLFKKNYDAILKWCEENKPLAPIRIARFLPVSKTNDSGNWHQLTLEFINRFGHDKKVLTELSANMASVSWTGSYVTYLEIEKRLYTKLLEHKNLNVRNWAKDNIEYLKQAIKREKISDEEFEINL